MAISLATATKTTAFTNVLNNWDDGVTNGTKLELRVGSTVVSYVVLAYSGVWSASAGTLVYTGSPVLFTVSPGVYGVDNLRLMGMAPGTSAYSTVLASYAFDSSEYRDYPNGGTFSLPDLTFTVTEE